MKNQVWKGQLAELVRQAVHKSKKVKFKKRKKRKSKRSNRQNWAGELLYTTSSDNQPVQDLKSKMFHLLPIGFNRHLFNVWRCQESYFHQTMPISTNLYGQSLTSSISGPARGELGLTLLIIAARQFCNRTFCSVKQELYWFTLKQPDSFGSPTLFGSLVAASSVGLLSLKEASALHCTESALLRTGAE